METAEVFRRSKGRPRWWGGKKHIVFTVVLFVVLATLDNAAIGVVPSLFPVIAEDLSVEESALGFVMALSILIAAFTSVLWGYLGDRTSRKRLLLYGTLIWGIATALTGSSQSFLGYLLFQVITALGLGSIASVGFSVLSDFVTPRRRGLIMSLWGMSQGIGMGGGLFLGGLLGAEDWRVPFFVISGAGLGFAVLYLFTYDPERGRIEPELAGGGRSDDTQEPRLEPRDIPSLATKPSNVWLILQGFTAQFAYGSLIWLPRLFTARAQAARYTLATATIVGSIFAILFQIGGIFSILGGVIGDRWQRRDPRGRAMLSVIGVLGAVPLYLALFFLPLHGLDIPATENRIEVLSGILRSLYTNYWVAGAFVLALAALALTSVDSPNWFALLSEVNLPEHRGTTFGLANMSNGIGRAFGIWLTPAASSFFEARFAPPLNFAIGLALFQFFFLPTGWCYYQATKTTPGDIAEVRRTLALRAGKAS